MRNLQKLLALVLALVMSLALVTVAGASDYTDPDTIKHDEAVEVVSALNILEGFPDGSFKGGETVTRAQMATIISKMLKMNTASYAGVAKFTDVKAGAWYENAISACYAAGIIKGYTNGAFGPSDPVTTAQATLMVIRALGEKEETGDSYILAAMTQGEKMDLLRELDDQSATAPMSRDAVAQLTLNTLLYSPSGQGYTVEGDTDHKEYGTFATMEEAMLYAAMLSATDGDQDYTPKEKAAPDTMLKEDFKVTRTPDTTDAFGRPATKYECDDWDDTLTFADDAKYTLNGKVTGKDLYNTVGATVAGYTPWTVAVDGYTGGSVSAPTKNDDTAWAGTDIGDVTEVYVDSAEKEVKVAVTHTYIATVNKVTAADGATKRSITLSKDGTFETEDFVKGDVVLYTKAADTPASNASYTIQTVEKAGVVSGKLTKIVDSKKYTVDGVEYAVNPCGEKTKLSASSLDKDVSFYVDKYNNIMKDIDATEAASEYIYILGNAEATANSNYLTSGNSPYTAEVYGVTADGVAKTYTVELTESAGLNTLKGVWSFETNSNGTLKLGDTKITATNSDKITVSAPVVNTNIILNSATVFVFVETESATNSTVKSTSVKTGNANIGAEIAAGKAIIAAEGSVAKVVFVNAAYADASTDSGNLVYISSDAPTASTTVESGTTKTVYTYKGWTNDGEEIEVTSSDGHKAQGVYKYNDDKSLGADADDATGTLNAINGSTLTIDTTKLNLTADTDQVFTTDDAELMAGQTVYYVKNASSTNDIDAIWVTKDQATVEMQVTNSASGYKFTAAGDVVRGTSVTQTVEFTVTRDRNAVFEEGVLYEFTVSPSNFTIKDTKTKFTVEGDGTAEATVKMDLTGVDASAQPTLTVSQCDVKSKPVAASDLDLRNCTVEISGVNSTITIVGNNDFYSHGTYKIYTSADANEVAGVVSGNQITFSSVNNSNYSISKGTAVQLKIEYTSDKDSAVASEKTSFTIPGTGVTG